ncbi:MAG TPA: hypothetical protein VI007_08315, partial [bacterium]
MSIPPPLTERVLQRLPGPRGLWVALWAAVSILVYELAHRFANLPTYPGAVYTMMSGYANLVGLIGARWLWRTLDEIRPALKALMKEPASRLFEQAGWAAGPLLLSVLMSATWTVTDFARYPGWVTAWIAAAQYFAYLPANTGLWMYAVIVADLYQLGRRPLHFHPFEEDRSLGVRPLGSLASRAIFVLSAGLIPLAVAGVRDARTFIALLIVYVLGIAVMFLALWRIHLQMLAEKTRVLGQARALVAEAIRPITASWTAETLRTQAQVLGAADQVERRAAAIQEWPFDETILTRIAAILTAV